MGEATVLDPDTLAFVYAELGERIRNLMPEDAVGGNLTGLDFAALLSSSSTSVDDLARQLVEMTQSPIPLLSDSLELVCQTAVATFPEDGGTVNDLRKTADHRLAEIGR
jgi:GGDEF domain-containing protein